jgi:hypothetical protein
VIWHKPRFDSMYYWRCEQQYCSRQHTRGPAHTTKIRCVTIVALTFLINKAARVVSITQEQSLNLQQR